MKQDKRALGFKLTNRNLKIYMQLKKRINRCYGNTNNFLNEIFYEYAIHDRKIRARLTEEYKLKIKQLKGAYKL